MRKSVFAYVYLSLYLVCVYVQLQHNNNHVDKSVRIYKFTVHWHILLQNWETVMKEENQTNLQHISANKCSNPDLAFLNRSQRPVEKPTQRFFWKRIKMIYRNSIPSIYKNRDCMTTIYHQSWVQEADSAVLPWTLTRVWVVSQLLPGSITEAAEEFLFPWPDCTRCQTL